MDGLSRRAFVALALAGTALAGCANPVGSGNAAVIDARVDSALNFLYQTYPGTVDLGQRAAGILVMPVVTEAGLGLGGSFGTGALRVGNSTVDYYSATSASAGLQIGAQQYSHVLFFMTQDALAQFRQSPGWVAGADIEYAANAQGDVLRADTTTSLSPVIAVVFGQSGLRLGATVEGTKYTRIIP
ncbi:YSC84-related protein [Rubellimicrobium mesophilum]|uniref:lipid-binding SYLF domain-containing protein n=1 Tax=Rubellimicrobium mesophilum TaxID=1123067 RepID=UPI00055E5F35|nr:YSC84-related protein [Rubellimicrobium mesophilum]